MILLTSITCFSEINLCSFQGYMLLQLSSDEFFYKIKNIRSHHENIMLYFVVYILYG